MTIKCKGPCPGCGVLPDWYKGPPWYRYKHSSECTVGNATQGGPRLAISMVLGTKEFPYVCSRDPNHTSTEEGVCLVCWAEAEALRK